MSHLDLVPVQLLGGPRDGEWIQIHADQPEIVFPSAPPVNWQAEEPASLADSVRPITRHVYRREGDVLDRFVYQGADD